MNQLLRGTRGVPGCHAVMFGSLPAGLSLPDSDIDVVLLQEQPPFPSPPPAEGFTQQQKKIIVEQLVEVRDALFSLSPPQQTHPSSAIFVSTRVCNQAWRGGPGRKAYAPTEYACMYEHAHAPGQTGLLARGVTKKKHSEEMPTLSLIHISEPTRPY